MIAGWADLWSLCSNDDVSTVSAFPYLNIALLEDRESLDILEKCSVSLFMMLLNCCYKTESSCKLNKAFLFSCLGKSFIHICPLVVLAFCCSL